MMKVARFKFDTLDVATEMLVPFVGEPSCTVVQVFPMGSAGFEDEFGLPALVAIEGQHYNILAADSVDTSSLDPYLVTPSTPQHNFFGVIG